MKQRMTLVFVILFCLFGVVGCGANKEKNLEGTCAEILQKVYENAALDEDFRESMDYFETTAIEQENAEYMIGTNEVDYTDSVISMPMMSSRAYQCILLRLEDGQDVDKAKETIKNHANPAKWVCVEAESTVVENVGDVILFIMADQQTAEAVRTSFLALAD